MNEAIINIKSSEQKQGKTPGKVYLEVIDQDDKKYSCWDEGLWNALGKNFTVKIGFELRGNFKNILQAEAVREEDLPQPKHEIAPQERGMWWKELGNRIGDGAIDRDYPNTSISIKGQYYKKMSEITGVNFKKE